MNKFFTIQQQIDYIKKFEADFNTIPKDELDSYIFTFVLNYNQNENLDNTLIDNWINFVKGRFITTTTKTTKSISAKLKRKQILKYEKHLLSKINNNIFDTNKKELSIDIDQFLLFDNSSSYYALLKSWEISEYHTWHDKKDSNIKAYLKKNNLK